MDGLQIIRPGLVSRFAPQLPPIMPMPIRKLVSIHAGKSWTCSPMMETEFALHNAHQAISLITLPEDAYQNVCCNPTPTNSSMVLKECAFSNVQLNFSQTTVQENASQTVPAVPTISSTGRLEPAWVYAHKQIRQNFMQTIRQEHACPTVLWHRMEATWLTETQAFEYACRSVQEFNSRILQPGIVSRYALGIRISMASFKISHAYRNATLHLRPTPKMKRDLAWRNVHPRVMPTTWLKDVYHCVHLPKNTTETHHLTSVC